MNRSWCNETSVSRCNDCQLDRDLCTYEVGNPASADTNPHWASITHIDMEDGMRCGVGTREEEGGVRMENVKQWSEGMVEIQCEKKKKQKKAMIGTKWKVMQYYVASVHCTDVMLMLLL